MTERYFAMYDETFHLSSGDTMEERVRRYNGEDEESCPCLNCKIIEAARMEGQVIIVTVVE